MTDDDLIHNDHVNPSMNQDSTKAKWTKAHLQGGKKVKLECMYLITICGLDLVPIHWMGVGECGAAEP